MDKITLWITNNATNKMVMEAVSDGFKRLNIPHVFALADEYEGGARPSVSYGVLRGTGRIYWDCERRAVPWWNVDRGFFKPGHPNGYYRIGYRHLQPKFVHLRKEDNRRWKALNVKLRPWKRNLEGKVLVCPPEGICEFYGVEEQSWRRRAIEALPYPMDQKYTVRKRTSAIPLSTDLEESRCVVTHSSNVALEAIVYGIPAFADTGFVRSWNNMPIQHANQFQDTLDREELCVQAANRQFLLDEIRSGMAWEMVNARSLDD